MTPIAHFEAVWERCAHLSTLHAYLAKHVSGVLQPDEILRAEWVARISALDLYIHELVAQGMMDVFEGRKSACPGYRRFQVSNEVLDRIRNAGSASDSNSAFDLEVREMLGRRSFQEPDKIADGVRLFSEVELWNEVALQFGANPANKTTVAKNIKRDLSLIVQRRNKIAHEGDLQPSTPREPWAINQSDVAYITDLIEKIVRAIDLVT